MSGANIQASINICINYMPKLFFTISEDVSIRERLEMYAIYKLVYKFTRDAVITRYYYILLLLL